MVGGAGSGGEVRRYHYYYHKQSEVGLFCKGINLLSVEKSIRPG